MTELKPCPFCSSDSIYISQIALEHWNAGCNACRCEMTYFHSKEEATKAWNTRADDGWIRVEDRLPDDLQLCTVYDKYRR